jgi:hypothetical protein
MKENYGGSLIAALVLGALACSPSNEPTPTPGFNVNEAGAVASSPEAGTGAVDATTPVDTGAGGSASLGGTDAAGTTGGKDAGSDAGATPDTGVAQDGGGGDAGDGGGGGGEFEACIQKLKPKCSYEDKEVACASLMTAKIPLSNGMTWGDNEVKAGPYGAFVEWNEGMKFATPDNILEATCDLVASTFGEPASVTQDVLNLRGQDLKLYTVFRPACMKPGEKYPVITWGNGTCGQTGGYATLLAAVASHGFVVVATNSRFTGDGATMLRGLDFMKAANEDPMHVLYQHLDLDKVGAMGHSQGSGATASAASDPRIDALILWNGGTAGSNVKPFLAVSGERDIGDPTIAALTSGTAAATQPGAWLFYHKVLLTGGNFTGHLTIMMQPERVIEPTLAWWKYMLKGDAEAKKMFVGADCGLCTKKDEYEFGVGKPLP